MSDALERVVMRNDFYKDNFRRMVFVLLLSLLANLILLISLIVMSIERAAPVYFASTSDGRLISVDGQSMPAIDNAAVLAWVSRTVPQLYAINYVSFHDQIVTMRNYFTPLGWQQFADQFSPLIAKVQQQKLIVSATLYDTPVVLMSGMYAGTQSWQVQVPVLVSYQEGDKVQTNRVIMQLMVQRTTDSQTGQALTINQVLEKGVS